MKYVSRKSIMSFLIFILVTTFLSGCIDQSVEQRIFGQEKFIFLYVDHFSEICGSLFLLGLFIFFIFLYWKKSRAPQTRLIVMAAACVIAIGLIDLWGTLNWSWDLPSQYFGAFYWTNMKMAAVGGLILSLIAFLPLFSRESVIYTFYLLLTKKQDSYLPSPSPLWFFIPWTAIKILFGMWLFSNMLVGLWILGGNGLTLFTKDMHALFGELLILGPAIASAMLVRIFIYCIHQVKGIIQYLYEGYRRMLTHHEYETIWGKIMKICGVLLLYWSTSSLFGITGEYEHLVGPYRHDLFAYMIQFGTGIGCMLVGGLLIGDTRREKLSHIISALLFSGFVAVMVIYYSPDIRVTAGFLLGVGLFPALYVVLWKRLSQQITGYEMPQFQSRGLVRLTGVSTFCIISAIVVALIIGSVGSNVWLKPQHRKDPLDINADLIDLELKLNALSAGIEFEEIEWEFPSSIGIESLTDIESLIAQNEDMFNIIRLWDADHAEIRFRPSVGLRWMEMGDTDIVRFSQDGELRQFWISPKNLNLDEILQGSENAWYNEHKVYTHSIGYIMVDALTGKFETREWTNNNIYFGEGRYRDFIYDFENRELQGAYTGPTVQPRLPLREIFTQELTFYTGDTAAYMNIFQIASELFPWMHIDPDPYLCIHGDEVWYSMDLGAYIQPSRIPLVKAPYIRSLVKVLINTETGEYLVFYNDVTTDTIILPLIQSMYGDIMTPLSQAPEWYIPQLRYPESFMETQVQAMNVYHVQASTYEKSKTSVYVHEEDFFEIPEEEDLRHVLQTFFEKTEFVSMITVEFSGKKVPNIAAIWVTRNDYPHYGEVFLIRMPSKSYEELRVIGTSVVPNALTADEEVSYWNKTHEGADIGNILLYQIDNRVYYFVPFYTGQEKTVTLQKVACVMGLTGSETESRKVGFGDDPLSAFKNLQLEILSSQISGKDIGTYGEAMEILAGETVEGESVTEIISEMNWILERRKEALAQADETEAARLLEEFFELFKKLSELLKESS
ncbi:MAG: UPF0182 family protein [Theionarchaea archaeon]|nr:UPF0182 family protein [Theionarchaea archaeon]